MLNIAAKLALGFGVLLVLCVIIGLASYTQTQAVNDRLEELTQVREPVNSAVYGIENDLAETAFSVLAYSATGDRRVIAAIDEERQRQQIGAGGEEGVSVLARQAGLRADLQDSIVAFHAKAMEQTRLRDQQVQNFNSLLTELQSIDLLLSERVLRSISVEDHLSVAYRRLQVALGMQVQMDALAKNLGNYMLTGDVKYTDQLDRAKRGFSEFLKAYRVVLLSDDEKRWAEELRRKSDNGLRLARILVESEKVRRFHLAGFMGAYRGLTSTLNDRVQTRTERGLARAKEELLIAGETTNNTILGVLAVSLVFGILAGVWTTRSITRPLAHLTSVMWAVGRGDRTRRVQLKGGDELQLVGDTFNAMVDQLKGAEEERSAGLRRFASSMQRAQEEERARLSRELHDDLCQRLTGMKFRVEVLEEESDPGDRKIGKQLRDVREELDRSIAEVRRISSNLRPSVLDDFGLVTALRLLVKDFEKRQRITVAIDCEEDVPVELHGDMETALYRIAQEALANIAKHAHATAVEVHLSHGPGSVHLRIHDNGQGVVRDDSALKRAAGHGLGLLGMRERTELLGGVFEIETGEGKGTTIAVRIPVRVE